MQSDPEGVTRRVRPVLAPRTTGGVLGVAGLLLVGVLGLANSAQAATRFVATTGDDQLGANTCLSAASPCQTITHALTQAVANDTIQVAAGTYDTALGESFPLVIAVDLTLTGAGAPTTTIDATGAGTNVITITAASTVLITGVTITGGSVSCLVANCTVKGGGLLNDGNLTTLTLTNVTVSGNTASCTASGAGGCAALGGGLFNDGGTLTLTNVTVSGNTASCTNSGAGTCGAQGGGLFNNFGTLTPTNVTVSGNTASCTNSGAGACVTFGGGLVNFFATLPLTNVTVSGNTASCTNSGAGACSALGGGLFNSGTGTLTLTATIVAKQLAGADCAGDPITSNGFNLDSDNTCNLTGTGDKPGVINPLLGSLQDNGGPTQTHALLPGSPAIDMVLEDCPPPATDQRGVPRPQGPFCDIGAYELQVAAPIPTLSEWAQLAMLTLLLGGGLFALRRSSIRLRPS